MEQYDNQGRMRYNPEYHENHGIIWSKEDMVYLCSMHGAMTGKDLSMALGRTQATVAAKLYDLKKQGRYNYYRNLGKSI